ncbi:MAG: GHMP kinase [Ilumatobacteraceae bacterium]
MAEHVTIHASAPTRICDNGGWTDTWFAEYGTVFSIAIEPRVHVELTARPRDATRPRVVIDAKVFGDRYAPTGLGSKTWGRHPLLEAAIVEVGVPDDLSIEVSIDSDAPFGASIGTSAATCVALVGALDALRPEPMSTADIARAAWRVETEQLSQQSGVQDQLAASFGGVNLIHVDRYPDASVERIDVPAPTLAELERRTLVVYLGAPHRSSSIHDAVIAELVRRGPQAEPLAALRETARPSAAALAAGDFDALGRAMIANTDAQRLLHRDLVGDLAERVIAVGTKHGALGYKVNGAGGDGGAITLLMDGDDAAMRRLVADVTAIGSGCAVLSFRLAGDGLRVERR